MGKEGEGASEPAKLLLPFLQRADELHKHDLLVAYYCRLYAADRGLRIPAKERTKTTNALLNSVMNQLEKDKKSLKLNATDDPLHIEGFALNVFSKADKQDRSGRADLNTAKTFYAASIFFEILSQFPDVSPEIEQRQKYAIWKAADIRKAISEGRRPQPGPPGGEEGFSLGDVSMEGMTPPISPPEKTLHSPPTSPPANRVNSPDINNEVSATAPSFRSASGYAGVDTNNEVSASFRSTSGYAGVDTNNEVPSFPSASGYAGVSPYASAPFPDASSYPAPQHHPSGSGESSYPFSTGVAPPGENGSYPSHFGSGYPSAFGDNRTESSSSSNYGYGASNTGTYGYGGTASAPTAGFGTTSHETDTGFSTPPATDYHNPTSDYHNPTAKSDFPAYPQAPFQNQQQFFQPPVAPQVHENPMLRTSSAPPVPQATNYRPSPDKVAEAHKTSRFVVSALAFDDVPTAISYLERVLELLTVPSATL